MMNGQLINNVIDPRQLLPFVFPDQICSDSYYNSISISKSDVAKLPALSQLNHYREYMKSQCEVILKDLVCLLDERDRLRGQKESLHAHITRYLQMAPEFKDSCKPLQFNMEPSPGEEAYRQWHEAVRRMARLGDGLPSFVRRRVWSNLADYHLKAQHVDWDHVLHTAFEEHLGTNEEDSLGSQITRDLHRTGCDQFGSERDKNALQRVLFGYARWNKRVGYCQGFNVIAATILEVTELDERDALKIMCYLIDFVLPESYFSQNLQALSVDVAVFRHLLQSRLPQLSLHLERLQEKAAMEVNSKLGRVPFDIVSGINGKVSGAYEPPLINLYAIQWFLTLFTGCLASDAVLRIWDSLLLEGSEIIIRTALVIMDFLASRLMRVKSSDQFYYTMSGLMNDFATGQIVSTKELMLEIYELAPFPLPNLKELREKFMYNIAPLVEATVEPVKMDVKRRGRQRRRSFRLFGLLKSRHGNTETDGPRKASEKPSWKTNVDHDERHNVGPLPSEKFQEIVLGVPGNFETESKPQEKTDHNSDLKKANNLSHAEINSYLKWESKSILANQNGHEVISRNGTCASTNSSKSVSKGGWFWTRKNIEPRKNEGFTTDISTIGPGAVGESVARVRTDRLSVAQQARMSISLSQLKRQYKTQLVQQRRVTLNSDVLFPNSTRGTGLTMIEGADITAVLPQTRESKQMSFHNSLDPAIYEEITHEDVIPCSSEDVLPNSSVDCSSKQTSLDCKTLPADLHNAVQAWREKTACSMTTLCELTKCEYYSVSPRLGTFSQSLDVLPSLHSDQQIHSDTASTTSCTYQSVTSEICAMRCPLSIQRSRSHSTIDSPYSTKPGWNFALSNSLTGMPDEFPKDDESSFFTSVSTNLAQAKTISHPHGRTKFPSPNQLTLQLPLSAKHRQFGARLGLYTAEEPHKSNSTTSHFCDRIRFVTMARCALIKQIPNQA